MEAKIISITDKTLSFNIKNNIYQIPLEYLIFGSKNSIDLDILIKVPYEFTQMNLPSHLFNLICEELDQILIPFFPNKPVNSSLGYYKDGQIIWCQKGADIAETNNSIFYTFHNHKQMYESNPIIFKMKRDVIAKIHGSCRNILCRITRAKLISGSNLLDFIVSVINIPEIHNSSDINQFINAIFCGITLTKPQQNEIKTINSTTEPLIDTLNKLKDERNKLIKITINLIKKNESFKNIVEKIIEINDKECWLANQIIKSLDNNVIINDIRKLINDFTISFNRVLRNARRRLEIGIRMDLLRMIDFTNIQITKEPVERFKNIAFQLGQTMSLMEGIEIYDKNDIYERYPILKPFLKREVLVTSDLENLNEFVKMFLDKILTIKEITRESTEILRH